MSHDGEGQQRPEWRTRMTRTFGSRLVAAALIGGGSAVMGLATFGSSTTTGGDFKLTADQPASSLPIGGLQLPGSSEGCDNSSSGVGGLGIGSILGNLPGVGGLLGNSEGSSDCTTHSSSHTSSASSSSTQSSMSTSSETAGSSTSSSSAMTSSAPASSTSSSKSSTATAGVQAAGTGTPGTGTDVAFGVGIALVVAGSGVAAAGSKIARRRRRTL